MSNTGQQNSIVIAGGSGFLGQNLAQFLSSSGHLVTILSRRPRASKPWNYVEWDGRSVGQWCSALEGATAIINLAGRTVDCIKTPEHCDEILRSRVESTLALGRAMREVNNPPTVWVQMSTAHIYGDPPDAMCDEDSAFGYGLAPIVGAAWEKAFSESVLPGIRQVILRTSFVLGRHGGAFPKLKMLARLFLGGKAGHGRQGISWIHETDMNRLFAEAIFNKSMNGTYVSTAPNPVSNAEFMRLLRRAIGRSFGLPATKWMIRFGARFVARTDPELILLGRYCRSNRLEAEGFGFAFPTINAAFQDLCRSSDR